MAPPVAVSSLFALALVAAAGCSSSVAPAPDPAVAVIPPPTSAPVAAPVSTSTAAPMAPSGAVVVAAPPPPPAGSAHPPIDRHTCQPHSPAVTFEVHDDDLVTPLDADGCPLGESHFKVNGFSYQASVELMADLQRRAEASDKAGLANLVFFPLRVNHGTGKPLVVKDRAAFLAGFDHIFTPAMLTAVHALDPRDVFCNYQGVAAGHGLVWANVDKGRHGVTVINQP